MEKVSCFFSTPSCFRIRLKKKKQLKKNQTNLPLRCIITCHLQRSDRVQGAERVPGRQVGPLHHVVVGPAEEPVFPQSELVPRDELPAARHAAKALDVVDLGASPHHEVVLGEANVAFRTFDAV